MQNIHVPKWAWEFYQACQQNASKAPDGPDEEKLNYLVCLFRTGKVPGTVQELEKVVDNHLAGNRQKLRRRNALLEKYITPRGDRETDERLALRDSLETIWRAVTAEQLRLLNGIGDGHRYAELSASCHIPTGTLKSTVSRVRSGLRVIIAD